jgi:inner membrane protein
LDSWNSKVGKKFWFLSWIFVHRGFLHSFVACVLFSLLIGFFTYWGAFGFFVGYLSHLLLDSLTFSGVALFWPLKFKVKGFVKSGGLVDDVLFGVLTVVDLYFVLTRFI